MNNNTAAMPKGALGGLVKTGIEWADFSANPIRGKCLHACSYCYAEDIRHRFNRPKAISWHPEVLEAIKRRKKPATIFMGSAHDLLGNWVKNEWLDEVIRTVIAVHPRHNFIFLTKNPGRYNYVNFIMGDAIFRGATVDTIARAKLAEKYHRQVDFLSIEPLLEDVANYIYWPHLANVIIGSQSGEKAFVPPVEWVLKLIEQARYFKVKVFLKNNLLERYPELPRLRELPWPLYTKEGGGNK